MEKSSNRSEIRRKPRVLCLHGFQTSGKMLEERIRSRWPGNVISQLDLVFVDAPFPAEGLPGKDGVVYEWFQSDQDFKEFYNFEECLKFLEDYMSKHGPFDGLLGFSQGAFLAATITGIQKNRAGFTKIPSIKFLIVISGGKFGYGRFGLPELAINAYTSPINCPSLHIIECSMVLNFDKSNGMYKLVQSIMEFVGLGESDAHTLKDESEALVNSFTDPVVIYHPAGHVVPYLTERNLAKVLEFIQRILQVNDVDYYCPNNVSPRL